MKTAISIPDDLFEEADRLARSLGTSRSDLYSRAVRAYVASHASDSVTERLDAVVSGMACQETGDVAGLAARTLTDVEW